MLKQLNRHERDEHIVFEEKNHSYFVDGDPNYISVTTAIKEFFPKFDSDLVISKMKKSNNWSKSAYFGMEDADIKKQWRDKADLAANLGTLLHASIENYYNNIDQIIDPRIEKEYGQFLRFRDFIKENRPELEPYRTEWCVYNEDYHISGSIDMIFKDKETDELHIFDWKRTPDMKKENRWDTGLAPICHLDDCKFIHYSLQLNIYKFILEEKYDKKVKSLTLVCFHPTNDEYFLEKVDDFQDEIRNILQASFHQQLHVKSAL